MHVRYTLPLKEQIKANRAKRESPRPITIFIRSCQSYVMAVDPKTRTTTADRQRFVRRGDSLEILPRYRWVDEPETVEVGEYRL